MPRRKRNAARDAQADAAHPANGDDGAEFLIEWLTVECARRPKLKRAIDALVASILAGCET